MTTYIRGRQCIDVEQMFLRDSTEDNPAKETPTSLVHLLSREGREGEGGCTVQALYVIWSSGVLLRQKAGNDPTLSV